MTELQWLAATCLLTASLWPTYVLNRMAVQGVWRTMDNPSPNDSPLAPWAERAQAAHRNAIENLVVFAPLVIVAHVVGVSPTFTATAAMVFFFARLAHFAVYVSGIPVVRTLTFAAGGGAQVAIVLAILGVVGGLPSS
jgi:uncharacterized MAPEG superfamily protein